MFYVRKKQTIFRCVLCCSRAHAELRGGDRMSDRPVYRPRLSIEISEEQQQALQSRLNHGEGKAVFVAIIDDLIDLIDEHGNLVVALIAGKRLRARDVIPSVKEANQLAEKLKQ